MSTTTRRTIVAAVLAALLLGIGHRIYVRANSGGDRPGVGPVLVVLVPAQRRPISEEVEAIGTALANESVSLVTKVSGRCCPIRAGCCGPACC